MKKDEMASLILARLQPEREALRAEFQQRRPVPTRYTAIDYLLPETIAQDIFAAFPGIEQMRLLNSFREHKYTSKALDQMNPLIAAITFAFQTPEVIRFIEELTEIPDMIGDPYLYAGGISTMLRGHFLNPHLDNSHDSARKYYRVLNLLYYVTPDWQSENGGNLELWDERVKHQVEIPSLFNRLVIMETNSASWHSVNRVKVAGQRCCVSNYYFSPHPPGGKEHFHITSFKARPEQHLRRAVTRIDSAMRGVIRKAIKQGVGRSDLYKHSV
ncbi:MAG: 2OG-Fe(II) oxygenase [Acidobacteria bacterium]|nr:2OG-Fe(II) oxygenase [Acidobacteriota bacterium]